MRSKMLLNKICAGSMLLMTTLAYANGDCVQEERGALASPALIAEFKQSPASLRQLLMADIRGRDTANVESQLKDAEKKARTAASPEVDLLYACLARAELQRREGNDTTVADDPKARGRSARVM